MGRVLPPERGGCYPHPSASLGRLAPAIWPRLIALDTARTLADIRGAREPGPATAATQASGRSVAPTDDFRGPRRSKIAGEPGRGRRNHVMTNGRYV